MNLIDLHGTADILIGRRKLSEPPLKKGQISIYTGGGSDNLVVELFMKLTDTHGQGDI